MQNTKLKKSLEIAAFIIFFSAFILSVLSPIRDPDMFWHLKTGEWIWQHRSLPDKDPFSFTVVPYQYETSVRTSFILKQYWLAQLIMYGFYQIGEFYGIVVFRCLIYVGIGLILYFWMGKIGVNRISRLILLIPAAYFSSQWLMERPANLSFLFAVVVVYLLEDLKEACSKQREAYRGKQAKAHDKCYMLLPLIMLFWANMHGGFILGDAIIGLYLLSEVFLFFYRNIKHKTQHVPQHFFIICLISILVSFINPNTYKVPYIILGLARNTIVTIPSTELLSPFYYASEGSYKYLIFICIMFLPFLPKVKQLRLNSALLVVFLVLISLKSIRYIPFLVFAATPFIANAWRGSFDKVVKKTEKIYIPFLLIFGFAIFLILNNIRSSILKDHILPASYPVKVSQFIKTERPEGEIFNDLNFGGYLIWSLYPDYRVFMDGRGISQSTEKAYYYILSGKAEKFNGTPLWKAFLNSYSIRAVLIFGANPIDGGFARLVRRMVDDNEWALVFIDTNALLFIKNTEKNMGIIKKYSMPKDLAYIKALEQIEFYGIRHPYEWKVYVTLGEINLYLKRPKVALLYFESAFKLNPSLKSTVLSKLIEELRAGHDYSKLTDEIFR